MTDDANDLLSDALGRICAPRWRAGMITIGPEAIIDVPAGYSSYYQVVTGATQFEVSRERNESLTLAAGDSLLLAQGTSHRWGRAGSATLLSLDVLDSPSPRTQRLDVEQTAVVYGLFPLAAIGTNPFSGILPDVIHVSAQSSDQRGNCAHIADMIVQQQRAALSGWPAVVSRLVQILYVDTLRTYLAMHSEPPAQASWLHASQDPLIGRVLARIHAEPQRPWTVHSLAKELKMSKSAFSERFRQTVGQPPLQYVTEYRMQRACELLRQSDLGIKEVASRVGYETASAFSNAFKRLMGKSPARFRKEAR